jgi:hypothetical protein
MTTSTQNPARNHWHKFVPKPVARWFGIAMLIATALAYGAQWAAPLEQRAFAWLHNRQVDSQINFDLAAAPSSMHKLSEQQALVVSWLSRKYRVAPEPLSAIVMEAFAIGRQKNLDPALILSVAANESRFNPLAQSPAGAQGLMQVMTRVHTEKFEAVGGVEAAFDPLTNLRVGSKILQDSIRHAGSLEGGLRKYVGAVKTDGRSYINKVVAEQLRLHSVMAGLPTSFQAIPKGMPAFSSQKPELVATNDEIDS